jgi:hypothetical protein
VFSKTHFGDLTQSLEMVAAGPSPSALLASDYLLSLSFNLPTISFDTKQTPLCFRSVCLGLQSSSSSQILGLLPPPMTTQNIIMLVPPQRVHLVHHLHKVLHQFNSTFDGEGIICAIKMLVDQQADWPCPYEQNWPGYMGWQEPWTTKSCVSQLRLIWMCQN